VNRRIHSRHQARVGFTLTELLVVVGLVITLALLSVVMVGRARQAAGKATAVTAMRQTGAAIFLFASDTNGYLPPGPGKQGFWLSHHAYNQNHTLFGALGPYLGVEPSDPPRPVRAAVSSSHLRLHPELLRQGSSARLSIYASSRRIELADGTRKEVFGWYTPAQDGSFKSALSLAAVQNARENGWKWLLQEADRQGGWSASWDANTFPEKPVHGDVRHRLLTDGTVVSLTLEESNLN
jgi:hypothetical protein